MKNPRLSIIGIMICLLFLGCKSEKEQVRDKIEQMKSCPIELCLDKMECRRNPLNKLDKKYTMVEYIDSTECTPCALNKLRIWNPLIMEARAKGVDINYIFIVAPKPSEMDDINLELGVTDLQSSVYIDTSYEFRKLNPSMPIDNKYHSFLLGENNEILFVGSPIKNEKVKNIYKRILKF